MSSGKHNSKIHQAKLFGNQLFDTTDKLVYYVCGVNTHLIKEEINDSF
jgi:hypothetical protein